MLDWNQLGLLRQVDLMAVVPSPDGVLTAAALLRIIGRANVTILLVNPNHLDKIQIQRWKPARNIALVNLGVDRNDPENTRVFMHNISANGHRVVAIADHHNRRDWEYVLGTLDHLVIQPGEKSLGHHSSGAVLLDAIRGNSPDDHMVALLEAADQADRGDYTSNLANVVNSCIKPSPNSDIRRRLYLIRHLAFNTEIDDQIQEWCNEYEPIKKNHQMVIERRKELGNGIVMVDLAGRKVDRNVLKRQLLIEGGFTVAIVSNSHFAGDPEYRVGLYTFGGFHVGGALQQHGVPCMQPRFHSVHVHGAHLDLAVEAIRTELQVGHT